MSSWNDIDFEKGLAMLSDTKNGTPRHTPIPNVIMDEIKKHREIGSGLLFPSSTDQNKPFDYKKQWANCLKAANIQLLDGMICVMIPPRHWRVMAGH